MIKTSIFLLMLITAKVQAAELDKLYQSAAKATDAIRDLGDDITLQGLTDSAVIGAVTKAVGSLLGGSIFMDERVCCATKGIYNKLNATYREINKDLASAEALVEMYNKETLRTIDSIMNRIDETDGISHLDEEALNNEIHKVHDFFEADYLPEKYSLNQIMKIAVIRSVYHDKLIQNVLDKSRILQQDKSKIKSLRADLNINREKTLLEENLYKDEHEK